MTAAFKIDSNVTELRWAEETSPGVLPGTPTWNALEPNDFKDFGGQLKVEARKPINAGRQMKKGTPVDLDAKGSFGFDLTQEGIQELMQGVMYADMRRKHELVVATVDGTTNEYKPALGGGSYKANDLLFAKYAGDSRNNGLKLVTGTPGASSILVTDTGLVDAATQTITISRVGFQFASDDLTIDDTGGTNGLPALKTTTKDLTQLGLIPGEWICIGDDSSAFQFATAGCNGLARVKDVAAHLITLDRAPAGIVDEFGAGKTVRLFFGRVIKNESDPTLFKRRTYQFERLLGKADSTDTNPQSEYLTRAAMDNFELDFKQGKAIDATLSFVAGDHELRTGVQAPKSGNRPTLKDTDCFNATSHLVRFSMAIIDPNDATVTDLFAYMTEFKFTLDNQTKANKAVKVLGSFDTTAGQFKVNAKATAYFANIAGILAVRQNTDVSVDLTLALHNQGWTMDLPLVGLGDGRADVKQDEAIMLPLSVDAATAARYGYDHTLLFVFWDYLPTLAK